MTEQELRALVREAVARHLGQNPGPALSRVPGPESQVRAQSRVRVSADSTSDPSHGIYLSLVNAGGECVIEPSVTCNHCNYCKSHGH